METLSSGPFDVAIFGSTNPDARLREDFSTNARRWREKPVVDARLLVSVVDDDESVRESLPDLLHEFGYATQVFASAEDFLDSGVAGETGCLILDVAMPGMSGPELQLALQRRGLSLPVVFITAHREEAVRARVLQQGAAGYLLKPFSDTALLDALKTALHEK